MTAADAGRPVTLLVVDDNADHRFLTKRALRPLVKAGRLRVLVAEDGEEALERVRDDAPAIMLLDIKMPRLDGFAVLDALRRSGHLNHMRVIMLSSSENEVDIERARKAGAHGYVIKAMDAAAFAAAVSERVTALL